MAKFNIVLYAPEIPGNTGAMGRTCLALDLRLILIRPYGFSLDKKEVRRAGLDYWKQVDLVEYDSFEDFLTGEKYPELKTLLFFSKKAHRLHYRATYTPHCYLVFGSETSGLPESLFKTYPQNFYTLPMFGHGIRSLNLSNAATAAAYECLRHLEFSQ